MSVDMLGEDGTVPHALVAAHLDGAYSISAISRIRAGKRVPSHPNMAIIARAFDWPLGEQVQASLDGRYASELEKRIASRLA